MNQINYDRQMQAQIESLPSGSRPTLLLHSCCGPCSSAVLERLAPHFDITVFFYNPNILPAEEYQHRLREQPPAPPNGTASAHRAMGRAV